MKKIRQVSGTRISGTAEAISFKFGMQGTVYEGIKICDRICKNPPVTHIRFFNFSDP